MAVSLHGNNGLVTTNGTAAAPSLAAPDTDTGLYFGTNLIHATTSGTERLRITSAGHFQLQGGTVYGDDSATATFKLQSTSGNSNHARIEIGAIQSSDNGGIHFYTAGSSTATRYMTLKGGGNLGIGIDNPTSRLYVNGVSTSPVITARTADNNGESVINILSEGTTGYSRIKFSDTAATDGLISYSHSERSLIFAAGGTTEQLRLTSAGVVDINNGTGQSHYEVSQTNGNTVKFGIVSGSDVEISGSSNNNIVIKRAGATRLTVTSSGVNFTGTDYGFNTTPGGTPASKAVFLAIGDSDTGIVQDGDGQLEIWGNAVEVANFNAIDGYTSTKPITTTGAVQTGDLTILNGNPDLRLKDSNHGGNNTEHMIAFQDSSGNNQMNIGSPFGEQHLRIKHGSTDLVKIQTDGKIGIGTTSPNVQLTVSSTSPAVCDIHHSDGSTNDEARIILGALANNPPSNRGAGIAAVNNGAGHDLIVKCSANHSTGPVEKFRIKSTGQVQLPVNGQELAWGASQQFRMFWENSEDRMYLKGNGAYGLAIRVNNGNRIEINKTTGDVIMQGASGRNFQWDNSDASLYLTDNNSGASARLKIGSGQDLQLYHDVGGANHITCATNQDLKVSVKTLQVYEYTGVTKKFETTNRGKVLIYHADTAAYGASNWARTGTGNQSNSSQASPEGSFQFQSNTGNGTMRFKSYIQATSANQTEMYIHLTNSGFYRITIEASHNSQSANVAMYLVYGLNNMSARIQQVVSSGNFSATTQNTHVNSHDTTLKISYSGSTNQGMRALVEQIGGF